MAEQRASRRRATTSNSNGKSETIRACTACRKGKKKCDRAQAPEQICSFCVVNGFQCLLSDTPNADPERTPHVKLLESRVQHIEKLLQRIHFSENARKKSADPSEKRKPLEIRVQEVETLMKTILSDGKDRVFPPIEPFDRQDIAACQRFYGESSHKQLIHEAREVQILQGSRQPPPVQHRPSIIDKLDLSFGPGAAQTRHYTFPDADLIPVLIDLYFANVNLFWALLHRPTFERAVADGLHLRDEGFATVLMLVCAAGARFSDDPRTFMEPCRPDSAGWQWFGQTNVLQDSFSAGPSLYAIQAYLITSGFVRHTSASQSAWTATGIGLRMAQAVGAHRRDVYGEKPSVRDELWKRAFWLLSGCDRQLSVDSGRPCAIQVEDYDLDLPIDCDDEYWTDNDPELAFVQPPGKPSLVSFLITATKLDRITGAALRNLYSIKKDGTMLSSVHQPSDRDIVTGLDSALNEWMEDMPEHLRWDEHRADERFFRQSVMLHSIYHCARITIHRNFIPTPRHQPSVALPSLSICTHAASSIAHMLDALARRCGTPIYQLTKEAFVAGTMLILAMWGSKRSGTAVDPATQMEDVHKCLNYLTLCESRIYMAGRLADLMRELMFIGERSTPKQSGYGPSDAPDDGNAILVTRKVSTVSADGTEMIGEARQTTETGVPGPTEDDHATDREQDTSGHAPVRLPPGDDVASTEGTHASAQPDPAAVDDPLPVESSALSPASLDAWFDKTAPLWADADPLDLWASIPASNEPEEWGSYIESLRMPHEFELL